MSKQKPNGSYSGLTGGLVLYERNGLQVMRARSHSRKDTSPLLGQCRTDFAYIMKLVRKMKKLTDIGFRDCHPVRSAYHSALSANLYNYRAAADKADRTTDLSWFQLSAGRLSNAAIVNANLLPDGTLEITWQGTEPGKRSHKNDIAIAGVYQPVSNTFITAPQSTPRSAGRLVIPPIQFTAGEPMTIFLFFAVIPMNYRDKSEANVSNSEAISIQHSAVSNQ